MDPITISALIGAGSSLIGGWMSGKQNEKEREQSYEDWKKMADQKRRWASEFKPQQRFDPSQNLNVFNDVISRAVMGGLQERMGDRLGEYGIDFSSMFDKLQNSSGPKRGEEKMRINPNFAAEKVHRSRLGGRRYERP